MHVRACVCVWTTWLVIKLHLILTFLQILDWYEYHYLKLILTKCFFLQVFQLLYLFNSNFYVCKLNFTEALPILMRVIQDSNSRAIENINATENTISAVTKICKYNFSHINVAEILPVWLSWLPVWEDDDEAIHIYGYLCDLVEM